MGKTEYIRECGVNYLRYPVEGTVDYRLKMLQQNEPAGFLPIELRRMDEWEWIYCRISGMIRLSQYLEKNRLGEEELTGFFKSVEGICRNMEEYLLPFEGLVLNPEYIYVTPGNMQSYYWIYSCEETDLKECVSDGEELLEYLLDRLSYEDQRAVKLLYAVYQSCRGGGGDLAAVRSAYQKIAGKEEGELSEDKAAEWDRRVKRIYPEEADRVGGKTQEQQHSADSSGKHKRMEGISGKIKELYTTIFGKPERMEKREPRLLQEERSVKAEAGTTLLTGGMMGGGIYCLKARNGGESDLLLTSYPFFIGKDEHKMDGVVEDAFVSRYHARIDREEDGFRVLDLGSTNGTFVNRERLEPYEARRIEEGDMVGFAHREYEFCFLL